ncbi:hypothetical protein ACSSZE_15140 [Acidithiobacillus caldus]
MTEPPLFVGIDVAKANVDLLTPQGKYRSKAFPNNLSKAGSACGGYLANILLGELCTLALATHDIYYS